MGDLYDQFAYSKFPHKLIDPKDEFMEARMTLEEYIRLLRKVAPAAKIFAIKGNHDVRVYKRMMEKLPEIEQFVDFKSPFIFDGVETYHDERIPLEIGDWLFTHVGPSVPGRLLPRMEYKNCVFAHTHRAHVHFQRINKGKIVCEANAGYQANPYSPALGYRDLEKYYKWTSGLLVIDEWPKFIPMGEEK
jgi:predicted phosphodiesterase